VSVESKSGSELRNVATTMCLTENSNDEWIGSRVQTPAGRVVVSALV